MLENNVPGWPDAVMLRWGGHAAEVKDSKPGGGTKERVVQVRITLRRCWDSAAGSGTCGGLCPVKQMQLRGDLQAITALASEAKDQM